MRTSIRTSMSRTSMRALNIVVLFWLASHLTNYWIGIVNERELQLYWLSSRGKLFVKIKFKFNLKQIKQLDLSDITIKLLLINYNKANNLDIHS